MQKWVLVLVLVLELKLRLSVLLFSNNKKLFHYLQICKLVPGFQILFFVNLFR
jgi:hypothetical protein